MNMLGILSSVPHITVFDWKFFLLHYIQVLPSQNNYYSLHSRGRAVLQLWRSDAGFPQWWPGFHPRSGHVGFVVDKVALGQDLSKYFGFPCQFSFHRLLHTHHHLSSGAGTIGQLVADLPSGLSLTPPQETEKKKKKTTSLIVKVGLLAVTYRQFLSLNEPQWKSTKAFHSYYDKLR
jgi:hypothetical protein